MFGLVLRCFCLFFFHNFLLQFGIAWIYCWHAFHMQLGLVLIWLWYALDMLFCVVLYCLIWCGMNMI